MGGFELGGAVGWVAVVGIFVGTVGMVGAFVGERVLEIVGMEGARVDPGTLLRMARSAQFQNVSGYESGEFPVRYMTWSVHRSHVTPAGATSLTRNSLLSTPGRGSTKRCTLAFSGEHPLVGSQHVSGGPCWHLAWWKPYPASGVPSKSNTERMPVGMSAPE